MGEQGLPDLSRYRTSFAPAWRFALLAVIAVLLAGVSGEALAHAIGGKDAAFVAATKGPAPLPFAYLGGKHMVTGYDHLLFLLGVIFFLTRFRDVALYVSLFALGHSITLLSGVLIGFGLSAYLVDAVIGLSVVYKAFDNLGGFETLLGVRPNPKWVVLGFGLVHGLGLATKLQDLRLNHNGLLINLVSFNVGVEIGQLIALSIMLALIAAWRRTRWFTSTAIAANGLLMIAGFCLIGVHLAGYLITNGA
ncbi:hypothetical protein ACVWYO_004070 [Sphingomonas sp. UYP23]